MLRRNPTRIELKLDDIGEYTDMRESEMKKEKIINQSIQSTGTTSGRTRQEIHDRIGYVPQPRTNA